MGTHLLIAIILLAVVLAGLFYAPPAPYGSGLKFVSAIAGLLLLLMAIGVVHV